MKEKIEGMSMGQLLIGLLNQNQNSLIFVDNEENMPGDICCAFFINPSHIKVDLTQKKIKVYQFINNINNYIKDMIRYEKVVNKTTITRKEIIENKNILVWITPKHKFYNGFPILRQVYKNKKGVVLVTYKYQTY